VLVIAAGALGLAGIADPRRRVPCAEHPGGALAGSHA
jgi:hypothetical protein